MSIKNRTKFLGEKFTEKGKPYYSLTRYPEIPLNINDIYVTTISGDRLDLLANQFYNDIRLWYNCSADWNCHCRNDKNTKNRCKHASLSLLHEF